MVQGIQDTLDSVPKVRTYGCYFLSVLEWALHDMKTDYKADQIKKLYEHCVKEHWMDEDCEVHHAHEIYNYVYGSRRYKTTEICKDRPIDNAYVIKLVKPGYSHFILSYGDTTWDPKDPKRVAARAYLPDSYRRLAV